GVWRGSLPYLAEMFESHFAEISHELAAELAIQNGEKITVSSPRGKIHVRAMVTNRFKPFVVDGKTIHQIGVPWHWGYNGISKGSIPKRRSAAVTDANDYHQET